MIKYVLFLISFAATYNVLEEATLNRDVDIVLLFISGICTLCGAFFQMIEMPTETTKRNYLKVFFSVPIISVIAWGIGFSVEKWYFSSIIGVIGGYMSMDILHGLKNTLIKVLEYLPEFIKKYIVNKIK